jgi:hypothetical protein
MLKSQQFFFVCKGIRYVKYLLKMRYDNYSTILVK